MAATERVLVACMVVLSCTSIATSAGADQADGDWTGAVELQGNYYWETSTRVVAPEIRARLTSPEGTDVTVDYLVDAITSASIAAGVAEDIRFTEVRHQVTAGVGHEFDLGDSQLRLDATTRVSSEPDYLATAVTLAGSLSLFERCTQLGMNLTYIHDDVGAVIRGGAPRTADGRDLSNRGRVGQLEGMTLGLSWSQVITATLLGAIGYDFVHNWGYLQNPYRRVAIGGVTLPETHPEARTRNSFYGRLAYFVVPSRTAFHALFRLYTDDWQIAAVTPEARVYQELGDLVTLRLRYRFYAQNRSFFFSAPELYSVDAPFLTADPKMADFHSHLVGLHARVLLDFLRGSILDFVSSGEIWTSFDYWWQTSRFGDGVIAQTALAVPF